LHPFFLFVNLIGILYNRFIIFINIFESFWHFTFYNLICYLHWVLISITCPR
jgi:hypothetical protein